MRVHGKLGPLVTLASVTLSSIPAAADSICYGSTARGRVENACQLPKEGGNFGPYSTEGIRLGRTYVHCTVRDVVLEAYAEMQRRTPATRFVYGETGLARGGPFAPHKTHQNGLSVDFFVPVIDARGSSSQVPSAPGNRWGYDVEFDATGRSGDLSIDFEAMAAHLMALAEAAKSRGIGIRRVYFDVPLQKRLRQTAVWSKLEGRIPFSTTQGWWRHDEHYHVDFEIPCRSH